MSRSPSTDRLTIHLFWQAALRNKRLLYIAALNPIGSICLNLLVPLCIGKALAALLVPDGQPHDYIPYLIAAAVIGALCNRYGFASLMAHQARTMSYLQELGMRTLLRRSVGFHHNNVGGKLVSDVIDLPQAYSLLSGTFFNGFAPFAITLIVGTIIVFVESWQLGLVILLMSSYTLISGVIEARGRSPLRKRRLKATKDVTGHLADAILNVFTIKTFAREQQELHQHQELNHVLRDHRLSDWRTAAFQGNNRIMVLLAMQIIFLLVVIRLVDENPALLGVGIFAFSFTITLGNKLFEVNNMIRSIEDGFLQASPMTKILQQEPEIMDAPGATQLTVRKATIDMQDVTFQYQDSANSQTVFERLSLQIAPGEKVGLVGPSGGGKSTLTRLLLRFEDINGGSIRIDGQDITQVTQASLRQAISFVPQEPLLFHRTIRENIGYGQENASDQQIFAAAKSAHAHDFIQSLPQGYDTVVGERGVKLSGGQRQRIAIARAVLKDAPILVLDEATSALDSESEVLIQQALWELMQDRTAIVIAHRLSTIQKMDRIVVLQDGAITEQGTHRQLLKQKGTYAKLWAHQSGGFIEDDTPGGAA